MITRRRLLGATAGLALAAGLTACGDDTTGNEDAVSSDGTVDLSKVTLIVADQRGTSAQAVLKAAGLDDTPYTIEWKQFTSGPPILEALDAGAVHVGQVGNTPPIFAAAAKSKFKIVSATSYTGQGDAILVPKDSSLISVSQLAGKKVAVAEGSSANYNLLGLLDEAGVSYSDVQIQNLQPADALAAFSAGHLDAWTTWEPYTSQAVLEDGARVLADGRKVMNGLSFNVASDAALADKATAAALGDFLTRIQKAALWTGSPAEEWAKIWATQLDIAPTITEAAVQKRPVSVVPIDQSVIDSEQEMADAFTAAGLLPGKVDVAPYFDDRFNKQASGSAVEAAAAAS